MKKTITAVLVAALLYIVTFHVVYGYKRQYTSEASATAWVHTMAWMMPDSWTDGLARQMNETYLKNEEARTKPPLGTNR